jgi:hypothetical protein
MSSWTCHKLTGLGMDRYLALEVLELNVSTTQLSYFTHLVISDGLIFLWHNTMVRNINFLHRKNTWVDELTLMGTIVKEDDTTRVGDKDNYREKQVVYQNKNLQCTHEFEWADRPFLPLRVIA